MATRNVLRIATGAALTALLFTLAACEEMVDGRSPAPRPDPDPTPDPGDERVEYNPPAPPGPTLTGTASGTLSVPGAVILSDGRERTNSAPTEGAGLMAVKVDGHVYLYHPELGDVRLSERTSELAVQYAIYGGAPGARAATLQPASDAATEPAPGRSYRKTSTGMNVRLSDSSTDHYTFENTTVLWHAVLSKAETQRTYFAPKSILGFDWSEFEFYLEKREERDVRVDSNDVELYRDILRGSFSAARLVATPAAIAKFDKAISDGANPQVFIDMLPIVLIEELAKALDELFGLLPFDQCFDIIVEPLLVVAESNLIAMYTKEDHRITSFSDALLQSLPKNAVLCAARVGAAAGTGLTSEVVLEVAEKIFLLKWAASEVLIAYDSVAYDAYATVPGLAAEPPPEPPTTGGKIYWSSSRPVGGGDIERANLDGSGRETVVDGNPGVHVLAISGGKMYWSNLAYPGLKRRPDIERANLDGSGRETVISNAGEISAVLGIAISGGKIYFTTFLFTTGPNYGNIERANLDGSGRETLISVEVRGVGIPPIVPKGIAISGGKMYWTTGSIERANLDGSGRETLITSGYGTTEIAIAGGKMYWSKRIYSERIRGPDIERANLDGSGREALVTAHGKTITGIVIAP